MEESVRDKYKLLFTDRPPAAPQFVTSGLSGVTPAFPVLKELRSSTPTSLSGSIKQEVLILQQGNRVTIIGTYSSGGMGREHSGR